MKRATPPKKRRITLLLAADSLLLAERIARARNVSLSTVVAEALSEGLQRQAESKRSAAVLTSYQKAFSSFSEEEMSILDGMILEPALRPKR